LTRGADVAPNELPDIAHPAWLAYLAMRNSKQAHFGFLETLDQKVQQGGVRTLAERARLDTLLAEHDRCVAEFAPEIKALGAQDADARNTLLRLMTAIEEAANEVAQ